MLTFRTRFFILIGLAAFTLLYVSVGIRWHVYRARASLYAKQELDHTFEAANYARAARRPGGSAESLARAASCRKLSEMHEQAALECARLREFYESQW